MRQLEPNRDIRQTYQCHNLDYLAAGMIAESDFRQILAGFYTRTHPRAVEYAEFRLLDDRPGTSDGFRAALQDG